MTSHEPSGAIIQDGNLYVSESIDRGSNRGDVMTLRISGGKLDFSQWHQLEPAVGPLDGKFKVEVRNPREKLQVTHRKSE